MQGTHPEKPVEHTGKGRAQFPVRRGQCPIRILPEVAQLCHVPAGPPPAYDYQQMVSSKGCTKKQLDNQLRVCRLFAESQISCIEEAIRDGSVSIIP